MIRSDVITSGRIAGGVQRYHTWPTLRSQTVAEHTWQSLRIYLEVFGPPPPHVSVALIVHDMGELHTGDIPFPVKKNNPHIAKTMSDMENGSLCKMLRSEGGAASLETMASGMSKQDKVRIKICDLIEMLEFGMEERLLGNRYADPIIEDMRDMLYSNMIDSLGSEEEKDQVCGYLERVQIRYDRGMSK